MTNELKAKVEILKHTNKLIYLDQFHKGNEDALQWHKCILTLTRSNMGKITIEQTVMETTNKK